MSVLYRYKNFIFIDHKEFITKIYENTNRNSEDSQIVEKQCFTLTGRIFSIRNNKEKYFERKKRTRESDKMLDEVSRN